MINQQLIDFVKQSQKQGLTKEKIISELATSGWTESDVEECFRAIDVEVLSAVSPDLINNDIGLPAEKSHGALKIIIIVIILLLIISGVYYFSNKFSFVKNSNEKIQTEAELLKQDQKFEAHLKDSGLVPAVDETKPIPLNGENKIVPASEPAKPTTVAKVVSPVKTPVPVETKKVVTLAPSTVPVVAPTVIAKSSAPIDCKENMSCFLDAALICSPATVIKTTTIEMFGLSQTNRQKYSLTGFDAEKKCKFLNYVIDAKVDFSQEMKETPEFKEATEAEKSEILKSANDSVKQTIGMEITCAFTTSKLVDLLTKWERGESSSNDTEDGNCSYRGGSFGDEAILL